MQNVVYLLNVYFFRYTYANLLFETVNVFYIKTNCIFSESINFYNDQIRLDKINYIDSFG